MKAFVPRRLHTAAVVFVCLLLVEAAVVRVHGFVLLTPTLPRLEVGTTTAAVGRTRASRRTTTAMSSSSRSKEGQRSREEEKKRTPREIAGESEVEERATCKNTELQVMNTILLVPLRSSDGTCV